MCNYLNVALDKNKHLTYLYWWNVVWFTRENTISNHERLRYTIGFRTGKKGHLLLPDQTASIDLGVFLQFAFA